MINGRLVADASIIAKVYLKDEAFADLARTLLDDFARGSVELVAPQLLLYEIPSAIERAARRGRISTEDANRAVSQFFELGIVTVGERETLPELIRSAYSMAQQLGCRIYDALYLVVAAGLGIPFITADRKLFRQVHGELDYVVWIADIASYEHLR